VAELRELDDVLNVAVPPVVERLGQLIPLRLSESGDLIGYLLPTLSGEGEVAGPVGWGEQGHHVDAICLEADLVVIYLGYRDSAVEMGADILRLGWGSVVDVAADVEVEVVLGQFGDVDHAGEAGDVLVVVVGGDDLLDVLGV
jgi:hypothetical protein